MKSIVAAGTHASIVNVVPSIIGRLRMFVWSLAAGWNVTGMWVRAKTMAPAAPALLRCLRNLTDGIQLATLAGHDRTQDATDADERLGALPPVLPCAFGPPRLGSIATRWHPLCAIDPACRPHVRRREGGA